MNASRWRSVLAEGVLIVGSILLAFSLDAWWNEREQNREVEQLLDIVASEFDAASVELDSIIGANEVFARARDVLIRRTARNQPPIPPDSLGLLAARSAGMEVHDPSFGALNALISGGRLDRVRDLDLRRALGGWHG